MPSCPGMLNVFQHPWRSAFGARAAGSEAQCRRRRQPMDPATSSGWRWM